MELSKRKFGIYSGLSSAKMRERQGLFVVEGKKCVHDTIADFDVEAIVAVKDAIMDAELIAGGTPLYEVSETDMRRLSSLSTPPDILAVYRLPSTEGNASDINPDELYLMLDGVRDPGNMGTIVRTAHWFGIKRIFASFDCVDIFNPKTIQSTMGSLGKVRVDYCDLASLAAAHPEMAVYGTLLDGANIYKANLGMSGFIVMGNEGKGLSEGMRSRVTSPLLIPPFDPKDHSESLNVAIATGIVLSQFRQRVIV